MSDDLSMLRAKIDALDDEILRCLNQRAAVAKEIGSRKTSHAYRPEREAQVLRRVMQQNPGPLSAETVGFLYREIMSACLALEAKLRVSFLGPSGTFTEAAAAKHFGAAAELVACNPIDEVFRQAEAGATEFAVVPVENSTEGAVGKTLDLMLQTPLSVCGEVMLRVEQHLLAAPAVADLAEVQRIYSHPQSFAQCDRWLKANLPNAQRLPASSNAEAARLAASEAGAAAVAGEGAQARYGLRRLGERIQDDPNNTTRFLVIGKYRTQPSGRDKTSFVMAAKNRPGAVHELLTPLAEKGVSMTKLESRPSRTANWEYVFFVDIEGHQADPIVREALAAVEERALYFKVFGSYPRAVL